jgi:hypothetical protein
VGSVRITSPDPSLLRRCVPPIAVIAALAGAAAVVRGGPGMDEQAGGAWSPWGAIVLIVDALTGALAVAGVLVVALAGWALWGAHGTPTNRSRRSLRRTLGTVVVLAVTPLVVWVLQQVELGGALASLMERVGALAADPAGTGSPRVDHAPGPALRLAAAAAGAVLALAAAGAWWWRDPAVSQGASVQAEDPAPTVLQRAVDLALSDLDADSDPRRAVLRCFAHLDAALAQAGCARRMAETAREHGDRAAQLLGPGAEAAARLVERFEHARYGSKPVTEQDRSDALRALRDVRAALAGAGPGMGTGPVEERAR